MEKEESVLHGEVLKSFTHGGKVVNLILALPGSSTWVPGIVDGMGLAVVGLVQITSDY